MMQRTIAGFSKAAVVATRTHGSQRCLSMVIPGPSIVTSVLQISFTIHGLTRFLYYIFFWSISFNLTHNDQGLNLRK